jgi:lantibiotic modifying enzyme
LVKSLNRELDWPDITHGAAGQGVAALCCGDRLQDYELTELSHRCADYLIKTQKYDGSWEMPDGVAGLSGTTLTGFAHGISGIIYFLAEYARRFESTIAKKSWQLGTRWIIKHAHPSKDGVSLEWNYSTTDQSRWKWWCHGSPGIALMFLRLYEQTANSSYAKIVAKSLHVHPAKVRYSNLSQCHGLSGLGEIYLEAARVLDDNQWEKRAKDIADTIINLQREQKKRSVISLVEDPYAPTADLMVGWSGILHFYMKFLYNAQISFPLLLDPIKA